jgi:hypothetical protein
MLGQETPEQKKSHDILGKLKEQDPTRFREIMKVLDLEG